MFAEHQPHLAILGRGNPAGFFRISLFALLTIRQPLRIACVDYVQVRQGNLNPLWGMKHKGYSYLQQHSPELWERCEYAFETLPDIDAENVILAILNDIPGIGPAKSGFICQMIYGLSGCIDTHNLKRFGIPERTFRGKEAKLSPKRLFQTYRDYNSFCRKHGGTEKLWNGWCNYLANNDPINYASGYRVSQLHLTPLEC